MNPTILKPEKKRKTEFALISKTENVNEIHGKQSINYYIWRISM
jgi:hypothetical protein